MGLDGPEIDCCCDRQTLELIEGADKPEWLSVCDNCGACWTEEGEMVGYRDELMR